jgi:hypothetical protein
MGPITPIDVIFGLRPAIAFGWYFMAHRGGFTHDSLAGGHFAGGLCLRHGDEPSGPEV